MAPAQNPPESSHEGNPTDQAGELSSLEVRRRLAGFQAAVQEIRKVYPRMEMGQLDLLLTIALKPGIRGADLLAQAGGDLTKSGMYKTLQALSDERSPGEVEGRVTGLDLLTRLPDPTDRRAYLLSPTQRGLSLMRTLASKLAT